MINKYKLGDNQFSKLHGVYLDFAILHIIPQNAKGEWISSYKNQGKIQKGE